MLTPSTAAALYLLITLVFTWPLAAGLARDIPWDLGDSLLNSWILAWDADHLIRLFTGDFAALQNFWNANIFHPEQLTLAYSEHLFAQAVQILPVYALTGNIVLCYNLLFLSTFVLSGLGAFLFVREITGNPRAAFFAGVVYAFAPYRIPQFAHLQVLSSQWMPFALFGLRRYFDRCESGVRTRATVVPLAGAIAALVAQNLSNGYYLLFFSPFVVAYVVFEIASRRLWRNAGVWIGIASAACLVAAATLPFLWPYLELRRNGFPPRTLTEVFAYSADFYSYWTAPPESHMWGRAMRAFPKPEGDLFPTLTALTTGGIGLIAATHSAWKQSRKVAAPSRTISWIAFALLGVCATYFVLLVVLFLGFRLDGIGPLAVSVRRIDRPLLLMGVAGGALLAVSPRARAFAQAWARTPIAFASVAALLAFALSFGPDIRSGGRLIGDSAPYALLYSYVPGFDGLRVPARFAMLVTLFLAVGAGVGAAGLEKRFARFGLVPLLFSLAVLSESFAAPIVLNGTKAEGGYRVPPPRVYTGREVPAVYRFLEALQRPGTVLVEFPFGEPGYEVRYMFYSTTHWHPLLNGYSGTFPLSYGLRSALLRHPLQNPERAWERLREDGATHAVVHSSLYAGTEGADIGGWLLSRGAKMVSSTDGDLVFQLK